MTGDVRKPGGLWRRAMAWIERYRGLRSRDIDAAWALVYLGITVIVAPMLMPVSGHLPGTLLTVGVLFLTFGGVLLERAYADERRRESDRLDAGLLREESER